MNREKIQKLPNGSDEAIFEDLMFLYGEAVAKPIYEKLDASLRSFQKSFPQLSRPTPDDRVDEKDAFLITYGDMVGESGETPLSTLAYFLQKHIVGLITTVHLLPFFPFSSDDGFSVIDYDAVNPDLGSWDDIAQIGRQFRLMFDAVINHISAESDWFQGYLQGDPRYKDYFIEVEPGTDLSQVFRPRQSPLLTPFQQKVAPGQTVKKLVWTTFSADQIDLNFANPDVLLDVIGVLLDYVSKGAEFIRLDAIAYIWKEYGTSSIHLPQTHRIIQLIRKVLDKVAPRVALITETNVPHQENISYFGDGTNEAQMVYNFSLPPLTLNAFHTGNATILSRWADTLTLPSDQVTYFNFLASHDGIGVTPARGYLSQEVIEQMGQRVEALGGYVSYRANPDGTSTPYELNISYIDALGDPDIKDEAEDLVIARFLASQAIMLAIRGVPGIYFHSLFGSRSWPEGVRETGRVRTINREKLQLTPMEKVLADSGSFRYRVFRGYRRLLEARRLSGAFHPIGGQRILFLKKAIFSLVRTSPDGRTRVLCFHNVSRESQELTFNLSDFGLDRRSTWRDLLSQTTIQIRRGVIRLRLEPYQVVWLGSIDGL